MAVTQTKAAQYMQENAQELSSHQVISLLMAGALERVDQARASLDSGEPEDTDVLLGKLLGIIDGLRSSLNLEQGGEIALNLDALYSYMLGRISEAPEQERQAALSEVEELISAVKSGWDDMDTPEQAIAS